MNSTTVKKVIGGVLIALGLVFVVSGAAAWHFTSSSLAAQHITVSPVSDTAPGPHAGVKVDGPLGAYWQTQVIHTHMMEASGNKEFADLDRNDPKQAEIRSSVIQPGDALISSLYESILAFGVAAGFGVVGVALGLTGYAVGFTKREE